MFQAGNLVTGVAISGDTDRLDLVDNDTIDAADITEWLAQAATANGHGSPYLRGDTELDRDVDITDFNALASHFDPTGDGDPVNGPFWNEGNFDGDGDTDITETVSEDDLLALERNAFVALSRTPASIARVSHMMKTGKPLRT